MKILVSLIALATSASSFIKSQSQPLPIAWGLATSAYQIEGAWNVDGKGEGIWDKWYQTPGRPGNANGFIAAEHYTHMKEDIALLGTLGATAYRFSVSWPRILPDCSGTVNQKGIDFYNDMIDEIIKIGATPILTMFHWDTPQACHDQYGSWMNRKIIQDFTNYADVLFQHFGDRVQYYLTMNEPAAICGWGFASNFWPPGVNAGASAKYTCQHYTNLVHASVVQLGRSEKYAARNFKFSLPLIASYAKPATTSSQDIAAAKRSMDFELDWNLAPLTTGDYSQAMKDDATIGSLFPVYTDDEKKMMKGTVDFIGVNYYSAKEVRFNSAATPGQFEDTGKPLGPVSSTPWQTVYPQGLRPFLQYVAEKFPGVDIIITECGVSVPGENNMTLTEIVNDTYRSDFFKGIYESLSLAVLSDKLPIISFLGWSLLDNFEWNNYDQRFGVVSVDYTNKTLTRTIKDSGRLLQDLFKDSKSPLPVSKKLSNGETNPKGSVGKSDGDTLRHSDGFLIVLGCFVLFF